MTDVKRLTKAQMCLVVRVGESSYFPESGVDRLVMDKLVRMGVLQYMDDGFGVYGLCLTDLGGRYYRNHKRGTV